MSGHGVHRGAFASAAQRPSRRRLPSRLLAWADRLRRRMGRPSRYAWAALGALGAWYWRLALLGPHDARFPLFMAIPVAVLCAVLLGRGPAIFAYVMSTGLSAYFLLQPTGSLMVSDWASSMVLLTNLATTVALCCWLDAMVGQHGERERLLGERARLLDERDKLQQEFRHRTNNDIQVVNALIRFQASGAADPAVKASLIAVAKRIQWVAHVHDIMGRLMPHPDDPVDSREFLFGLGGMTHARMGRIEAHDLTHVVAKPLGVVMVDLVAAGTALGGEVKVSFSRRGADYVLRVEDLSGAFRADGGGRLATSLATQLGGALTCRPGESGAGTVCEMRFPAEGRKRDDAAAA